MNARKVARILPRADREASAEVELQALNSRQAMRLLEHVEPDDPPRRVSGAGYVLIGCVVAVFVLYGLFIASSVVFAN